jgi:hypothetical protein
MKKIIFTGYICFVFCFTVVYQVKAQQKYNQFKVQGKDTMFLYSTVSIDSVPFAQGIYNIPEVPVDYVHLFKIHSITGIQITNQDILPFKIKKRQDQPIPGGLKLNYTHSVGQVNIKNCMQFPKTNTLVALGKKGTEDCLLISRDKGKAWSTKFIYVPGAFKSSAPLVPINENRYYWLGGDATQKKCIALIIDSTGKCIIDSVLSTLQAYSMQFCDDKSAFVLCRNEAGNSSLCRSLDNGVTWKEMCHDLKGNDAFIMHFFDADNGYIRITVPPNKTEILFTKNGGNTWENYESNAETFNPNNQNILYCQPENRYYSTLTTAKQLNKIDFGIKGLWIQKITFLNTNTFALINSKFLLLTKDGAKNWIYIPLHASVPTDDGLKYGIGDAIMVDEKNILFFGNGIYSGNIEE